MANNDPFRAKNGLRIPPSAGITAYATGGQANAVELTEALSVVDTVATSGDSVKFDAASPGKFKTVTNRGATSMDLFPATGDNLGAGVDTAISVAVNETVTFYGENTTNWVKIAGGATTGLSTVTEVQVRELIAEDTDPGSGGYFFNSLGSGYDQYVIEGEVKSDLAATDYDGVAIYFNGDETDTNYFTRDTNAAGGNYTSIAIAPAANADSDRRCYFTIWVDEPEGATYTKTARSHFSSSKLLNDMVVNARVVMHDTQTAAITSVKIKAADGGTLTGTVKIYGVKSVDVVTGITATETFPDWTTDQGADNIDVNNITAVPETAVTAHVAAIDHDSLLNFVANEHIDHSSVSISAGVGLSGGGDITATRTLTLDLNELGNETTIAAGDFIPMVDITDNGSQKITWTNLQSAISITNSQVSDFAAGVTANETSHSDVLVDGDFASQGLMKRGVSAGSYSIVTDNSGNWDTAFGWGDHSTQGYLTAITGEPLSDLSDVTITTIASGELLKWNGSAWINNTLAEAGIQAVLSEGAFVDGDKTKLDGIATSANNYTHPSDGVDPGAALTGADVFSDITVNAAGHVTGSATRSLSITDLAGLTTSVTAYAGGGQANAVELSNEFTEVTTVATTGDSVKWDAAAVNKWRVVVNSGSNALDLFPATGDNLSAGVDTAVSIPAGQARIYYGLDSTNWVSLGGGELPSQTGQSGKYLTTNGTSVSWANVIPTVTAPTLGGSTAANEEDELLITISNYDPLHSYSINVGAGSYTRVAEKVWWTLPTVTADTNYSITVTASYNGGTSSGTVHTVTVFDVPAFNDDAIQVVSFSTAANAIIESIDIGYV